MATSNTATVGYHEGGLQQHYCSYVLVNTVEALKKVQSNKKAARCLEHRCHLLVRSLQENVLASSDTSEDIETLRVEALETLSQVRAKTSEWAHLNPVEAFFKQGDISDLIRESNDLISASYEKLQLDLSLQAQAWKQASREIQDQNQDELITYLSQIRLSQVEMKTTLSSGLPKLLGMMQELLDQMSTDTRLRGIKQNILELQSEFHQALPYQQLECGEVKTAGLPVYGSATSEIYQGLYLDEKGVAVKVLRLVKISDNDAVRRFKREGETWAKIWALDRGRHIVPFYGFFKVSSWLALVSPWQDRGTAIQYVQKHNDVNYRTMIYGIASGIAILHGMNPPVVHGDIRGTNVLINVDGNPRLCDFGLSKVLDSGLDETLFTQTRDQPESERWSAPEVYTGNGFLSRESDIYSFAMTVLELITQEVPFREVTHRQDVLNRVRNDEIPSRPREKVVVKRGLDDTLWDLLQKCWNKAHVDRPSIRDVMMELGNQ